MNIALIAALSETNQPEANFLRMQDWARKAKDAGADMALFGEAFLQGFEAMTFDYAHDIEKTFSLGSHIIARICAFARETGIALGFGWYENDHGAIYASYMLVSGEGQVLANYRRMSPGWKEPGAHADYRGGKHFLTVRYLGKTLALMLCGDFWEDHLLPAIVEMDVDADAFLWPVHCDYAVSDWEAGVREEYRERSQILEHPVLFINNYAKPVDRAKGGLYHWYLGKTVAALEMGEEGMLVVEV